MAATAEAQSAFDDASSLATAQPDKAAATLQAILARVELVGDDAVALKEKCVYALADIFVRRGDAAALGRLLEEQGQPQRFFSSISKAKTGKMVRTIIDQVVGMPTPAGSDAARLLELQIQVCESCIEWCNSQERTFLRMQIDVRLGELYLRASKYHAALKLVAALLREVKKLDDKHLLVEVHLLESRIKHALKDIPKAKAALTACRAAGNSIYVVPKLQAEIDIQAGSLCVAEGDFKTAFSYFYEAFEGFDGVKDAHHAALSLKYMLLSKVMNEQASDVTALANGKLALKYASRDVESMQAVAKAYRQRSLQAFQEVVAGEFAPEIQGDLVVAQQLTALGDKLLQNNLLRIVEPYSRVEISHVASLIQLAVDEVQRKLSQMILDKKLNAILDQGQGAIILFEDSPQNTMYQHAVDTIGVLDNVVSKLFDKAKGLD